MKDQIFDRPDEFLFENFAFDKTVASVFDDMVGRSVPEYATIQSLLAELAHRLHSGRPIYDLGCSTGTTIEAILSAATEQQLHLVGIDDSASMLEICRNKLMPLIGEHELHLEQADIKDLQPFARGPAGVIILCLVLQFLRPSIRQEFIDFLYTQTAPGGCILMVEKTMQKSVILNSVYINCYHSFKMAKGYSMLEIAKKREALENRLIPYYPEENMALLRNAGFSEVAVFHTWLNFQGYIALRGEL